MAMSLHVNRKRHSPSKVNNTEHIIPGKILTRYYALNIENKLGLKAIDSKKSKNLKYSYTGCGVVGTTDAATFKLIKLVTLQLYSQ